MTTEKPRHLSMIRNFHLADAITLCNAASGAGAVFAAMSYLKYGDRARFFLAAALLPLALVFDVLDGRVARWRHTHSLMGRELDSLADVISFGVAPAALAYSAGLNAALDVVVLLFFVGCGVSRLARYNVTADALSEGGDKVKYFEGTPITSSLLLVIILTVAVYTGRFGDRIWLGLVSAGPLAFHPIVLLWAVLGCLMASKTVRVPKI